MLIHKLLVRQLKRLGIDINTLPTNHESWLKLIEYINTTYTQNDQDDYLRDRAMAIVTDEMNYLNEMLNRLQTISHMGYWHNNLTTGINVWSKELYKMFEVELGTPAPKIEEIYRIIYEEDLAIFKNSMNSAILENKNFDIEIRIKRFHQPDEYKWYHILGQSNSSHHHSENQMLIVIMDINNLKTNEEKIINLKKSIVQSEKMAVLGQLSAGIAHEINNPLSYVLSNMSTLEKRHEKISKTLDLYQSLINELNLENPGQQKTITEKIIKFNSEIKLTAFFEDLHEIVTESFDGLLRIKKIVSNIRNFSGSENFHMELINIKYCIESAISVVSKDIKDVVIHANLSELPTIKGSYPQLMIAFVNLLLNAIEAIKEKGKITISSKIENNIILVSIKDEGCGIPLTNQNKIFTPFFTTKPVGSGIGLGLATTYGIIKAHKGKITFESETGNGSIFTIEIPIIENSELKIHEE
jgi:signal transduction histidine kinase